MNIDKCRIILQLDLHRIYSYIPITLIVCCYRWRNNETYAEDTEKCGRMSLIAL